MSDFLSDDWFASVTDAGSRLPERAGEDLAVAVEVSGAPAGKVRASLQIRSGRIESMPGKPADADCAIVLKYADAVALADGSLDPDVGFMQGRLKIDGSYSRLIFDLRPMFESDAVGSFVEAVRADTTYP